MRPLELLLTLATALALLPIPRARPILSLLSVLGLLAHAWAEGLRWQLAPVYLVVALLALVALRQRRAQTEPRRWASRLARAGGLLLVAMCAALAWALPIPAPIEPGGPYAIGTVSYHLVDPSREEIYTEAADASREIMVQLWYPTAAAPGPRRASLLPSPDRFIPALARSLRLPAFALSHLGLVRLSAFEDVLPAHIPPRYPVVLYAHGWGGFRTVAAHQLEALASQGFVAVAIDHTYGALLTVFPDGRIAPQNPDALPDGVPDDVYDRASEALVATYAGDLRFVLDQLERWDAGEGDTPFAGRLDLERVGLFGHSTGGGAVVRACAEDARCRAGLGMDAWVEPVPDPLIAAGLTQPFLFIRSEAWTTRPNDARLRDLVRASPGAPTLMSIAGTVHRDFTLQPLLSPLASRLGLSGTLPARRALAIGNDFIVAFFQKHLNNQPSPLLDGPSPAYPEVRFDPPEP